MNEALKKEAREWVITGRLHPATEIVMRGLLTELEESERHVEVYQSDLRVADVINDKNCKTIATLEQKVKELEEENERDRGHGRDFIRLWNEGKKRIKGLEDENATSATID